MYEYYDPAAIGGRTEQKEDKRPITTPIEQEKTFDYASALALIQDFLGEEEFEEENFSWKWNEKYT